MCHQDRFTATVIILSGIGVALLLGLAIQGAFNLPVVQISHASKECVQVIPEGSCDNLPLRYSIEWVK